jgi:hypothetical protein
MKTVLSYIQKTFKEAKANSLNEWQTDRKMFVLEGMGTFLGLTAAFSLAAFGSAIPLNLLFAIYLTSSLLLLASNMMRANSFLIILCLGYSLINFVGIINNF